MKLIPLVIVIIVFTSCTQTSEWTCKLQYLKNDDTISLVLPFNLKNSDFFEVDTNRPIKTKTISKVISIEDYPNFYNFHKKITKDGDVPLFSRFIVDKIIVNNDTIIDNDIIYIESYFLDGNGILLRKIFLRDSNNTMNENVFFRCHDRVLTSGISFAIDYLLKFNNTKYVKKPVIYFNFSFFENFNV